MKKNKLVRNILLAGASACMAPVLVSPAAAQGAAREYSIPAQDLDEALRRFAIDSGVDLVFDPAIVRGKTSRGVSGRHGTEQALQRILVGTGLVAIPTASGGFTIAPSTARDAAGDVGNGDGDDVSGREIVVTGTNLRGTQPTSPLITFSRKQIEESGATSVEDFMRKVPQNFQGGVNDENFFASQPGVDRSDHGAGLNLRGLGQRATLVLVNGRRLAPGSGGAFVDVSLIPATAIERIEILTDGASAIYGSDAVGGVVNFILREDFKGIETSALAGTATNGDGDQLQLGVTAGESWGSGRAMISYEYRLEDEVLVEDRHFSIGRKPESFFLPRERRHSILGLFQQQLGEGLTIDLNGSYAVRNTERTYFYVDSALPIGVEQQAKMLNLSGELRYELGGDWLVRAEGLYSRVKNDNFQSQPGGDEFVNSRYLTTEIYGFGLKADGGLFDLPGGSVKLALGAETRWENYLDVYANPVGGRTWDSSRNVKAAFAELLLPLFSSRNRQPGFERLQLSAAARYEDYGRLGNSFDPKLGLLWSPVRDFSFRASYGTSFRAPLLSETGGAYNVIYVPASWLYADPAQAVNLGLFIQGSNPDIGPETSRTWTVGGEFTPSSIPGLTFTANYYSIRFSNRIAAPLTSIAVIGDPAFESLVDRAPTLAGVQNILAGTDAILDFTGLPGGARPEDVTVVLDGRTNNTAETTTDGIDLGLNYAFGIGGTSFVLDANVNHIMNFKDRLTVASPIIVNLDVPYRPLDWRGRLGLSWTRGSLSGNFILNYADGYRDNRASVLRRVDSFTTLDAGLSYSFTKGVLGGTRISFFVENLFDTDPPLLVPDPGSTTGSGYDPVNASGRGRFVSLQLRKSW